MASTVNPNPIANNDQPMDQMWGESSIRRQAMPADRASLLRDGNYGMFIHWGLYSQLGGVWKGKTFYGIGEWIMHSLMAGIPVDAYKAIAKEFNPVEFDASAIVGLAKAAGMKYIVITSKHHEGFAMYDSAADDFNIVKATPFARDPMKELADECRDAGLGFGFYYSHFQDWTAPGGHGGPTVNDDGSPATFDQYFYRKCLPQVREIVSHYGPLSFVWFDTPGSMEKRYIQELYDLVHTNQPAAMVNSRIGHGWGDYSSEGDMEIPPRNIDTLWEACDTTNDSWSYAWYDQNFKSSAIILRRLIGAVGRGGAYLLNVGPDSLGRVPATAAYFLREAGKWIARYPDVVYAAGPSPWGHALAWGDVTMHGDDTLFLCVFDYPADGKLWLPGLQSEIASAGVLDNDNLIPVPIDRRGAWTSFTLPAAAPDIPASIVVVKLKSVAQVDPTFGVYPNIKSELLVEFAQVADADKARISWMEKFGEWKFATQVANWGHTGTARWIVDVHQPGYYHVSLRYKGVATAVWRVQAADQLLENRQPATAQYQLYPMGMIQFKTSGRHEIVVSLLDADRVQTSLQAMEISPVI